MRKGTKRALAFVMAGVMTFSGVVLNGGTSHKKNIVDAAAPMKQDSASSINYMQVLGGAVDYGIVADSITQHSHMETTFATNTFVNETGANNDVDFIKSTALFLIQSLGKKSGGDPSKIYWGLSTASSMYLEGPQDVFGSENPADDNYYNPEYVVPDTGGHNGNIVFGGEYTKNGQVPVIKAVNPNAYSNVDRLINRISAPDPEDNETGWSKFLNDRANDPEYVLNPYGKDHNSGHENIYVQHGGPYDGKLIIDIDSEEFYNKTVYVDVTASMLE